MTSQARTCTARSSRSSPACPRTRSASSRRTSGAASEQGAHLPGLRRRHGCLAPHRTASQMGRGPHRKPHSTGFARDFHMHGELALRGDKITGLRVRVCPDNGAFFSDAQPTRCKAGLFDIVTGSYDIPAADVQAEGAYTNKAPGGVAYRCSFRVTEASYLIERLVQNAAYEIGVDPAEFRRTNFIRPDQFPTSPRRGSSTTRRLRSRVRPRTREDRLRRTSARSRKRRARKGGCSGSASPPSRRSSERGTDPSTRSPACA